MSELNDTAQGLLILFHPEPKSVLVQVSCRRPKDLADIGPPPIVYKVPGKSLPPLLLLRRSEDLRWSVTPAGGRLPDGNKEPVMPP